jgi:DNA-binding HxlR family transcriptional regulator
VETVDKSGKNSETVSKKEALVRQILDRVADKWTMLVIFELEDAGPVRFSQLRARIGGVSQKMLTKTLRQLERDGLVRRTVYAVIPPRVEYRLTRLGETLAESLCSIWLWVEKHVNEVERARRAYDGR